jgi:hypothetical protein
MEASPGASDGRHLRPGSQNWQAQRESDRLVALPRGKQDAIFLTFFSLSANYDDLRPTFEKMLQSVQL